MLGLIIGFGGGATLAAVDGARRTSTAVSRLASWPLLPTVVFASQADQFRTVDRPVVIQGRMFDPAAIVAARQGWRRVGGWGLAPPGPRRTAPLASTAGTG